jgi:hypothetical protein
MVTVVTLSDAIHLSPSGAALAPSPDRSVQSSRPNSGMPPAVARGGAPENREGAGSEKEGRGTWRHAAFHVATTIATPAAYAPLPFAVASLGWPLGEQCLLIYI